MYREVKASNDDIVYWPTASFHLRVLEKPTLELAVCLGKCHESFATVN